MELKKYKLHIRLSDYVSSMKVTHEVSTEDIKMYLFSELNYSSPFANFDGLWISKDKIMSITSEEI